MSATAVRGAPGRALAIDVMKAVAAQTIVLHHLAFYGPMADLAAPLAPALFEALARHGRIAVQVFLVVAGFLAARALAPQARLRTGVSAVVRLRERYLRLVLPLAAMLVLAIAAAALARSWMDHPSVPGPADGWSVLVHLLLLQDLLGVDALSAGVWYLAIDLQLFAVLLGLLSLAGTADDRLGWRAPVGPWLVAAAAALSLLVLNRIPALDVWAPYFFGAYGLGVMAAWWREVGSSRRAAVSLWLALGVALWIDPRTRIALAAAVALMLMMMPHRAPVAGMAARAATWLGRTSYALFLVHFPVCLVVNAAFVRYLDPTPTIQLAGVLAAWAASVAVSALFHRWVEVPALRTLENRRRMAVQAV